MSQTKPVQTSPSGIILMGDVTFASRKTIHSADKMSGIRTSRDGSVYLTHSHKPVAPTLTATRDGSLKLFSPPASLHSRSGAPLGRASVGSPQPDMAASRERVGGGVSLTPVNQFAGYPVVYSKAETRSLIVGGRLSPTSIVAYRDPSTGRFLVGRVDNPKFMGRLPEASARPVIHSKAEIRDLNLSPTSIVSYRDPATGSLLIGSVSDPKFMERIPETSSH
ncbi:MAG: hypothetical protein JNK65_06405 [Deltaproteobacteria bacterium]|nr:hypothetical protein [Deltaproteobacteria bacterium]